MINLLSNRSILTVSAVVDIAVHSGSAPVTRRALASRHTLPERHLEPVLQRLVHAGILVGMRGSYGGYTLALPESERHEGAGCRQSRTGAGMKLGDYNVSCGPELKMVYERGCDRGGVGPSGRSVDVPDARDELARAVDDQPFRDRAGDESRPKPSGAAWISDKLRKCSERFASTWKQAAATSAAAFSLWTDALALPTLSA
jgi:hypothetical protein